MTTMLRKLHRCEICGMPYLRYCVPCYKASRTAQILAIFTKKGITDEYLVGKLKELADKGNFVALLKLMKMRQLDIVETLPTDVGEEATQASLAQMLEELEACESAQEAETVEKDAGAIAFLPAPPEK